MNHYPVFDEKQNIFTSKLATECFAPNCKDINTTNCISKLCGKKFCLAHSLHNHLTCKYGNCDELAINYTGLGSVICCKKHAAIEDAWRSSAGWRLSAFPPSKL